MNIFVLDRNPRIAASFLHPKLLVKMPLESCQMVAAVFSDLNLTIPKKDGSPYKVTHKNHPCTKWAASSGYNLAWLIEHGLAICHYYSKIYHKVHSCQRSLLLASELFKDINGLESSEAWHYHTEFVIAAPQEFKNVADTVEAYRAYMQTKSYATWSKYPEIKPFWWGKPN